MNSLPLFVHFFTTLIMATVRSCILLLVVLPWTIVSYQRMEYHGNDVKIRSHSRSISSTLQRSFVEVEVILSYYLSSVMKDGSLRRLLEVERVIT